MTDKTDKNKAPGKTVTLDHEQRLTEVSSKDPEAYQDESLAALTVYSLYWLHAWELRRTIEAVAVLNWRLFPAKFGMVGFEHFPDAFRTNRSLLQGQPKYRNWLTGSAKKGYNLNARGMQLAEGLISRLGPPSLCDGSQVQVRRPATRKPLLGRARTVEPRRVVAKIRQGMLFKKWQSQALGERDIIHVHSLLDIFDHTPADVIDRKLTDIIKHAKDAGDEEVGRFLEEIQGEFPEIFEK
ncbi:hypothetical protein LCGC14_0124380 [marine sediment metagenome]|uniref:Uncharacterized protein n=1 Tax=marine sediment metagenome TaxID=412755 RepID=A0A0F9Y7Q0_9ZZZZ|nr:hypothetical protein [Phycisphaerae bacterium]HDZ42338.1 hypothetical protein [Phycisphaerae bacterium]